MSAVRTKLVRNMTEEEYEACRRLNMGPDGSMRSTLKNAWSGRQSARTFMIWEENELVAWALLFNDLGENLAHTYVREDHRRKGLGRRLIRQVVKRDPEVRVCPWNAESRDFYASFGLRPGRGYHYDRLTGLVS